MEKWNLMTSFKCPLSAIFVFVAVFGIASCGGGPSSGGNTVGNGGNAGDNTSSGGNTVGNGGNAGDNTSNGGSSGNTQASGPTITSIHLTDKGSGADRVVTFGLPLPEGELDASQGLVVTDSNGQVLQSQWNPLATWRTDGSVLHGVVSFVPSASSGNDGEYIIQRGTPSVGSVITKGDVAASAFDATIKVNTSSGVYSLSAGDLLNGTITPRENYVHFQGPLASEFVVGGPLRLNGTGNQHSELQGYFHIRAFGKPVDRVYVTMVLENTGVFHTLNDIQGDVSLSVGGQVQYTKNRFTIGADKRYPKRFWWGGDPQFWVQHDVQYIQATGLTPEYVDITISNAILNGYTQSVDWNGVGDLSAALDSAGSAPHLAPLDRFAAAYLISGDHRAYNAMMAHADVYHWVVSKHDDAMNPRDENTGFPLDLADHPDAIGHGWGGIAAARQSTTPIKTDMAHQPNCPYLPYLLTGDFDYLEQCQFWAVANWIMERPGSHVGWPRPFYEGQTRGVAWGFRNIVNAAVITPDKHPLKQTLDDAVVYAIDSFRDDAIPLSPLGILATGPGVGRAINRSADMTPNLNDTGDMVGFTPWEDDYLTWAIGSAYERGYRSELISTGVWDWKAKAIVARLGDGSSYCWAYGTMYALGIRFTQDGNNYTTWKQLFDKNFPNTSCPPVGSTDVGTDRTASDYGAQMAPAIAVAADTGVEGAAEAYKRYQARDFSWWSGGYEVAPEWAIKKHDGTWNRP